MYKTKKQKKQKLKKQKLKMNRRCVVCEAGLVHACAQIKFRMFLKAILFSSIDLYNGRRINATCSLWCPRYLPYW